MARPRLSSSETVHTIPTWEESERRAAWFVRNFRELLASYPEQHIVVVGEQVVAFDDDMLTLMERVRRLGLKAPEDVAIEFVTTRYRDMVL